MKGFPHLLLILPHPHSFFNLLLSDHLRPPSNSQRGSTASLTRKCKGPCTAFTSQQRVARSGSRTTSLPPVRHSHLQLSVSAPQVLTFTLKLYLVSWEKKVRVWSWISLLPLCRRELIRPVFSVSFSPYFKGIIVNDHLLQGNQNNRS